MRLPRPRGPVSAHVVDALSTGAPFDPDQASRVDDVLGDDAQLALWLLLQLHFRDVDGAPDDREWDPDGIALRGRLEAAFEKRVRELVAEPVRRAREEAPDDVADQVFALVDGTEGPSLAAYLHREASREEILDFLRQRSIYHLKESDAHSFVLPRVGGGVKVALAELQYDEYGAGRPDRLHADLFARALEAAGLDATYGAYVDEVSVETLAVDNLISMLALQRRLRAASLGQLAAFEATSSMPCRKIAAGIERVGLPADVAAYFHEHVEADAVHEQVAVRSVCGALAAQEPTLAEDVLVGAAAYLVLDRRAAESQLTAWHDARLGSEVAS
jgi:hypothetical protein